MAAAGRARRIALAIESSGPGGAEQMVLRLASALQQAGDLPLIATLRPGWMTERAAAAGIPTWIEPQRPGLDPLWVPRFALRLRRERVDFVHTHEFAMNVYAGAAARLVGLPTLATVHGHHYAAAERRRVLAYRALHALGMGLGTVSADLAEFLSRALGLPRERIHLVPNGIPVLPGTRDESARREARAALGLPPAGALVVAVGNLYPVKDHATLIRAVAALPGCRVAIAGRGEEEPRLRELAAALGAADRVHLLGLRSDVDRVLCAGDVFAQPSRNEGLPLALLEAMGAGLPVVVTRVGGMAEVVREGESGFLVAPGDVAALGAALGAVLGRSDRGRELGAAGRARVQAEYSVERMAARYRALYGALSGSAQGASAAAHEAPFESRP